MKYRINYEKKDRLIYVSHLDMQRTFQRLFRRAGLDLEFSQGFNPHPLLSYTPPVPLFASSSDEYLDVSLKGGQDDAEVFEALLPLTPDGLVIKSVKRLNEPSRPLSECFKWAEYKITLGNLECSAKDVNCFYECRSEIIIEKLNKKKQLKKVDILPMIKAFCVKDIESDVKGCVEIECTLSMANEALLNPFTLIKAIGDEVAGAKNYKILTVFKQKAY